MRPLSIREIKKKINLLGDPEVGKTSLILRFVKDIYDEEYLKTIGTNFYKKDVTLIGGQVKLMIQDIMGETQFDNVQKSAFQGSAGALAVADVTREETLFNLVDNWLPRYRKHASKEVPVILAINKDDLDDKEITNEEIDRIKSYFDYYFFTSAKSGSHVEDAFQNLASRSLYRTESSRRDVRNLVNEEPIDNPKRLLSALFAYSSELGDISYEQREEYLQESGIDKFTLESELESDKVEKFADFLKSHYEEKKNDKGSRAVENLIEKYRQGFK